MKKIKIVQITSSTYENIGGGYESNLYGLAEDGSLYTYNEQKNEWEFLTDSPVDEENN